MKRKKDCPVLKGFYVNDIQIKVWCPFCQEWHYHGACGYFTKTEGEGHRAAHCDLNGESPLRATGYYVQVFTRRELKGCDVKGELKGRQKGVKRR
ncbi:hypothetical protein ES705_26585 [subsurface metagenome]